MWVIRVSRTRTSRNFKKGPRAGNNVKKPRKGGKEGGSHFSSFSFFQSRQKESRTNA